MVGASQRGKTNTLQLMADQLVTDGVPLFSLDIEGKSHSYLLNRLALEPDLDEVAEKFLIVDLARSRNAFLPLNFLAGEDSHAIIQQFLTVLSSVYAASFEGGAARLRSMAGSGLALAAAHNLSLAELDEVARDPDLTYILARRTNDPQAQAFSRQYRNGLTDYLFRNWWESSSNKLCSLPLSPILRPCLEASSCIDFAALADKGISALILLDEPKLGEELQTLGALLTTKVHIDSANRAEGADDAVLILDEAQTYIPRAVENLISRRMKRGIKPIIAHQTTNQLDEKLFGTILGNCNTRMCFGLSNAEHAQFMVRQMFTLTGTHEKGNGRYWSIAEESEHYSNLLQQQGKGESILRHVAGGDTYFVGVAKAHEYRQADPERVLALIEKSEKYHLASRASIETERELRRAYLQAMREEVVKLKKARNAASAARRRRS